MRNAEMVLALMAFGCGLMGAWFWFLASRVAAIPLRLGKVDPGQPDTTEIGWISGLLVAGNEIARLNKVAALWTAASVALGAISRLLAAWPL